MFLWRSLTPAAIASVAAALTRAKSTDAAPVPPVASKANSDPSSLRDGVAKN